MPELCVDELTEEKRVRGDLSPSRAVEHELAFHDHDHGAYRHYLALPFSQFRAMVVKRLLTFRRNPRALFFQLIYPVIYICVLLAVNKNLSSDTTVSPAPLTLSFSALSSNLVLSAFRGSPVPFIGINSGPQHSDPTALQNRTAAVVSATSDDVSWYPFFPNAVSSLTSYLSQMAPNANLKITNVALATRGLPDVPSSLPPPSSLFAFTLWVNASADHAPPLLLDLVTNCLLAAYGNASVFPVAPEVELTVAPFAYPASADNTPAGGITMAILAGIAFSAIPVGYAVGLVREREAKAKHLQVRSIRKREYTYSPLLSMGTPA